MSESLLDQTITGLAREWDDLPIAVGQLKDAQAERTVQLINVMAVGDGRPLLRDGAELLDELPGVAQAEALGNPLTALWATYCKNKLLDRRDPGQDLRHYNAIAAGTAIRVGHPIEAMEVPIQSDGSVFLPGLGTARFAGEHLVGQCATVAFSSEGYVRLDAGDQVIHHLATESRDTPQWQNLRTLTANTPGIQVEFDDLNPYRSLTINTSDARPAKRVSDEAFTVWQERFHEAIAFLSVYLPRYLEVATISLQTIVPLEEDGHRDITRSTELGAVGLSMPPGHVFFGSALVEELRYSQIHTLHRLAGLYKNLSNEHSYRIPNEDVPVSVDGLFAAAACHTTVTDVWSARYAAAGDDPYMRTEAEIIHASWRHRLGGLLDSITEDLSGCVTKPGALVIDGLRANLRLRPNNEVPLEHGIAEIAHTLNLDHRICWQLRNLRPSQTSHASIERLAAYWMAAQPLPDVDIINEVVDLHEPETTPRQILGHYVRKRLYIKKAAGETLTPEIIATANGAVITEDYARAHAMYTQVIEASPLDSDEAWAGLALTHTWVGSDMGRRALQEYPEVVRAVYEEIHDQGSEVNPSELAAWLGGLQNRPRTMRY